MITFSITVMLISGSIYIAGIVYSSRNADTALKQEPARVKNPLRRHFNFL